MDLDSTLIRAESLFKKFQRLVQAIDKEGELPRAPARIYGRLICLAFWAVGVVAATDNSSPHQGTPESPRNRPRRSSPQSFDSS